MTYDNTDANADGTIDAPIDNQSVDTGKIQNKIGNAKLQSSFDGLIVPVADGLGMADAIDPTQINTPVQDAIDKIGRESEGTILLPPKRIQSPGGIVGWNKKNFLGKGVGSFGSTVIEFDPSADNWGFEQDSNIAGPGKRVYFDGIRLSGGDSEAISNNNATTRNTGGAFRWQTESADQVNFGRVNFRGWAADPILFIDNTKSWFDSFWANVIFDKDNDAKPLASTGSSSAMGGTGFTIANLQMRVFANNDYPAIDAADTFRANIGDIHIEGNLKGIKFPNVNASKVNIGLLTVESTNSGEAVIDVKGGLNVHQVEFVDGDFDYLYKLQGGCYGYLARPGLGGQQPDTNDVKIATEFPGQPDAIDVIYTGRSTNVDNNPSGNASTNQSIRCMADGLVADPGYSKTVTLSTGSSPAASVSFFNALETSPPNVQKARPTSSGQVSGSYGFDLGTPEYDSGTDAWVYNIEWTTDPGSDVEIEIELLTNGVR